MGYLPLLSVFRAKQPVLDEALFQVGCLRTSGRATLSENTASIAWKYSYFKGKQPDAGQ